MAVEDREIGSKGSNPLADAAIGAFAGAIGVWAMDRLDWFMWRRESPATRRRTTAVRPGVEPPAHVITTKLEKLFRDADFASKRQPWALTPQLLAFLSAKAVLKMGRRPGAAMAQA